MKYVTEKTFNKKVFETYEWEVVYEKIGTSENIKEVRNCNTKKRFMVTID